MVHEVLKSDDLSEGDLIAITISKTEILLTRNGGKVYAISDRCGHINSSFAIGKIDGEEIECSLHNERYNIKNGKVTQIAQKKGLLKFIIPSLSHVKRIKIKTFEVHEEDNKIKIKIEE